MLRFMVAMVVLLPSMAVLAWGVWPFPNEQQVLHIRAAQMAVPSPSSGESGTEPGNGTGTPPVASAAGLQEDRRLTLQYPGQIRAGDTSVIRLSLEVEPAGGVEATGNAGASAERGSIYEAYSVAAEADLHLAGVEFDPGNAVTEPLVQGETVTYLWRLRPTTPGTYRGTAWLFLVFTDRSTGASERKAISAQPVTIRTTTLVGLGGSGARLTGGIGTLLGVVLALLQIGAVIRGRRRAVGREIE